MSDIVDDMAPSCGCDVCALKVSEWKARAARAERERDALARSERAKSDLLRRLAEVLGAEDHTQLVGLATGLLEERDAYGKHVGRLREALQELYVSHQILDDMHCNDLLRESTTSPAEEKAWSVLDACADIASCDFKAGKDWVSPEAHREALEELQDEVAFLKAFNEVLKNARGE